MSWKPYSLHFKQSYANGYRYLDKCGEFMLAAKEQKFMPGEITITGGQLTIPEHFLHVNVGAAELTARQELPPSEDFNFFLNKCQYLTGLADEKFGPLDIQSNGFATMWFLPATSAEDALVKSLRFKEAVQDQFAKDLDMVSSSAKLDFNFSSGNLELHVVVHPAAFENVTVNRHNLPLRATREQKTRVKRLQGAHFDFPETISHALMINSDLIEYDPPKNSLEKQFELLQRKADIFRKRFINGL